MANISTRIDSILRRMLGTTGVLDVTVGEQIVPVIDLGQAPGLVAGTQPRAVAAIRAAAGAPATSSIAISTDAPGGARIDGIIFELAQTTAVSVVFATGSVSPPVAFGSNWGGRQFDDEVNAGFGTEPSPFGRLQLAAVVAAAVPSQNVARVGNMRVPQVEQFVPLGFYVPPSDGSESLIITTGALNQSVSVTAFATLIPNSPPWRVAQQ